MKSLWGRLALGLATSLLLFFAIQWWISERALHRLTEDFVVSRLEHDAENLLGAVRRDPASGAIELNPSRITGIYNQPFSGHYYSIAVGDLVFLSRSLWDASLTLPDRPDQPAYVAGPDGQQLLLVVREYQKLGQRVRIAVAEDMTPLNRNLANFLLEYAVVAVVMILLVIVLQTFVVRRSLRPLERLQHEMVQLERGETVRLSEDVPTEIAPLVGRFNDLLAVMKGQLERSRTAIGNLAHALKTPLTVLGRLADEEGLADQPRLRQTLVQQVEAIRQQTDRQLKRARLASVAAPGGLFDAGEELPPLAQMLERIHADRGIEIELELAVERPFPADREDMLELFGNLLDNACKWARRRVVVRAEQGDELVVSVEDDGPGCPAPEREQLTRRGVRIDESTAGHGLGLSIAGEIVDLYGGRIEFSESTRLGGFLARVTLPGLRPGR